MPEFTSVPIPRATVAARAAEIKTALGLNLVENSALSSALPAALATKANAEDAALTGSATAVNLTVSGTFSAKIGAAEIKPLITDETGAIVGGLFGTTAGTFCEGDKPVRRDHVLAANGSGAVFESFTNIVVMNVTNAAIMAAWGDGYQANTLYITVPD